MSDEKPYWYPEKCDPDEHEYGWGYYMSYPDNLGDAIKAYTPLADAYLNLLATLEEVYDSDHLHDADEELSDRVATVVNSCGAEK